MTYHDALKFMHNSLILLKKSALLFWRWNSSLSVYTWNFQHCNTTDYLSGYAVPEGRHKPNAEFLSFINVLKRYPCLATGYVFTIPFNILLSLRPSVLASLDSKHIVVEKDPHPYLLFGSRRLVLNWATFAKQCSGPTNGQNFRSRTTDQGYPSFLSHFFACCFV